MIRVGEIGANVTKVILGDELALDGADLIPIDYGGRLITPSVPVNELGKQLLRAAGEGNIEETKALLGRGALFTADWLGTSPLHLAARNNHLEICEILLNAGISRDARTKVDKTSLHMAAYEGHVHVVETLLEHGADPDCKDMLGMTPLQWAVQNGHVDVVKTLIKHFAETTSANKFDLAAVDIATQINRQDLVDIITTGTVEPRLSLASEHLTMELMSENSHGSDLISGSVSGSPIPLETILMEENNVIEPEKFQGNGMEQDLPEPVLETNSATFAESIKLLQEHGITMLPHDDDNILSTVMQTGHSVVLTDIGKEVLNSLKEEDNKIIKPKKILTVTPEEFLVMTNNCNSSKTNILKQINGRLVPKNVKRIIMKKNKILPVSTAVNTGKAKPSATDMETVMMQLVEAKKTIEEYKIKLYKKEQEAERYKQQLKLLMDNS